MPPAPTSSTSTVPTASSRPALQPVFNKRTDEYGAQNFENRCRFAVELLDAIRRECGNKIAIEYRLSCTDIVEGSPEVEEVIEFAKTIQDKIDMLLISRGCLAIKSCCPSSCPHLHGPRH
ncbi:MAG: hypothetical protein ACLUEK_03110 [Oscillospiraceae bacterium]